MPFDRREALLLRYNVSLPLSKHGVVSHCEALHCAALRSADLLARGV